MYVIAPERLGSIELLALGGAGFCAFLIGAGAWELLLTTDLVFEPDTVTIKRRRLWSRRDRIGRADLRGVAQLSRQDQDGATTGLALVLGPAYDRERMPVMSHLSREESAWLGGEVARFARVPFVAEPDL